MPFPLTTLGALGPYEPGLEGKHARLHLNWSEAQLGAIVAVLRDELDYPDLPHDQWLACAAIARTVFVENQSRRLDVRLSLAKTFYTGTATRYRHHLEKYTLISRARKLLEQAGWIEGTLGNWRQRKQTVVRATERLIDLCTPLIDVTERPDDHPESIILRDADKQPVDYPETEHIRWMRRELEEINAAQATQTWLMDGEVYKPGPLRRMFAETMQRGGRAYHSGQSHQNCKKATRHTIKFVADDGEVLNTAEWDYANLHPRIAYDLAGAQRPDGDLYEISDLDRKLVKIGMNALFSADSVTSATWSLAEVMAKNNQPQAVSSPGRTRLTEHDADEVHVTKSDILRCLPPAQRYIEAIHHKHPGISHLFGTDLGARLQVVDSNCAIRTIRGVLHKTGIAPLCMHDSFIGPARIETVIQAEAEKAYRKEIKKLKRRNGTIQGTEGGRGEGAHASPVHMEVVTTSLPVQVSASTPSDFTPLPINSHPPPRRWGINSSRSSPPTPASIHSSPPVDEGCPLDNEDPFSCPERYTPAEFMAAVASYRGRAPFSFGITPGHNKSPSAWQSGGNSGVIPRPSAMSNSPVIRVAP